MGIVAVGTGRGQPRLTTPIPARVRRASPGADVLVCLTRGLAGKGKDHVDVATSLGLQRWGDQVLLRARDRTQLGMAYKIKHLVTITYFDHDLQAHVAARFNDGKGSRRIPGTDYWQPVVTSPSIVSAPLHTGWANVVSKRELVPESGLSGGYFEFENEEYLQVEVAEDGASVIWSSDLPATTSALLFEEVLGAPDKRCYGLLVELNGSAHEETSAEVLARAGSLAETVRTFSVGYPDSVVSWRRSRVKMRYGKVPHVELAVSCEHVNVARLLTLIAETATDSVRETLAKDSRPLVESLGTAATSD